MCVRENWRGPWEGQAIFIPTWVLVGYHAVLLRESSQRLQVAKNDSVEAASFHSSQTMFLESQRNLALVRSHYNTYPGGGGVSVLTHQIGRQ